MLLNFDLLGLLLEKTFVDGSISIFKSALYPFNNSLSIILLRNFITNVYSQIFNPLIFK